MSPTSYQAAPPRINTLSDRPLYASEPWSLDAGVTVARALLIEAPEYRNPLESRQPVILTAVRAI